MSCKSFHFYHYDDAYPILTEAIFFIDKYNEDYQKKLDVMYDIFVLKGIGSVGEDSLNSLTVLKGTLKPKRERILEIMKEMEE